MANAPSVTPAVGTHQRSARILGVLASVVALALASASALAITELAGHQLSRGLWILLAVLVTRALSSLALDEWSEARGRQLRAHWRRSMTTHLAIPVRVRERARSDLALAIEHASDEPSLERLKYSAASSLGGVVVLYWAAGWLPLVITVGLLTLAAPLYRRAGRRSEERATQYQARRALLEARQLEVLHHAPELRALGAVDYGANEIAVLSDSEHALALGTIRVALESSLVTEFLSGVSIGLVAMVVGFALLNGRLSLLRALIALLVTSELFTQVRRYGVEFHRRDDAARARAALELNAQLRTVSTADTLLVASELVTESNLEPLTFEVRGGDRVVFTGRSGIGKTTLLHTLLGWRPLRGGTTSRAASAVGYVSAESSLMSASIRDNVVVGSDHRDDVVAHCLRSLGLDGPRFEDLDTVLLADGRGVSAGEHVRLVLARALLSGAPLIVLDDIAGLLDELSRDNVRHALDRLPNLAVIEATVDTPLLVEATQRIRLQ